MKCAGAKCITPIASPSPLPDFGIQVPSSIPIGPGFNPIPMPQPTPTEIEAMMQPPLQIPRPPFDNFVFKQRDRYRNLRG